MSLGRTAFVGGIALHGAESVEGPFGCEAGVLVLVERSQPLRNKSGRGMAISAAVAGQLDCFVLARVPRRRGDGIAACRPPPAHAHWSTMGKCRIRPWLGEGNAAAFDTTKARTPRKNHYGSKPAWIYIRTLAPIRSHKVSVPSVHETPAGKHFIELRSDTQFQILKLRLG